MSRPTKFSVFCLSLLFSVCLVSFADDDDPNEGHMKDNNGAVLCSHSVFMHGYIHGYQEGFHNADVDIQMGHSFREVSALPDYKKMPGYQLGFGDKSVFEHGYHQGFLVGYTDGMSGRSFRAIQLLRTAAEGLAQRGLSPKQQSSFEMGIQEGYHAGQTEGLHDGRAAVSFRNSNPGCTALQKDTNSKDPDYCEGFRRAFAVGYSDGYTNQQDNPHVAAK